MNEIISPYSAEKKRHFLCSLGLEITPVSQACACIHDVL
jgi:hypothetical protein